MKKKIIIIATIIIGIFTAIGVTLIINNINHNGGAAAAKPKEDTTKLDVPQSGAPLDFSLYDNVAILAGKIDKNKKFTTIQKGKVVANVGFIPYTQTVYNRRVVNGNEMLQEAISESTFKSVAAQNYFIDGKVLMRSPNKIKGDATTWKNDKPDVVTYEDFSKRFGFLPLEMSPFVLNKYTILDTSTMEEIDGGYQIVLDLDPSQAIFYYKNQVRSYASASADPTFISVKQTIVFDKEWNVISLHNQSVYNINMPGLGSLKCNEDLVEEFSYPDEIAIPEVNDYYGQYKNLKPANGGTVKPTELTPIDYLQSAFGAYLTSKGYLNLNLKLNDKEINGNVSLNLGEKRVVADLNGLAVLYDGSYVYVNFGNKTFRATIETFMNAVSGVKLEGSSNIDSEALMNDLNNAVITKTDNNVLMQAKLNIMGIELNLDFYLDKVDGGYDLNYIEAKASVGNLNVYAKLSPLSNMNEPNFDTENYINFDNASFIIDDIVTIFNNKKAMIIVSANVNGNSLKATIKIDFNNEIKMLATIEVLNETVDLYYANNCIYVDFLDNKLRYDVASLNDKFADFDINSIDFAKILDIIFGIDYNKLFNSYVLELNKLNISLNIKDNNYDIEINDDENGFIVTTNCYDIKAFVSTSDFIINEKNTNEYLDITFINKYLPLIKELASAEAYNINLNTNVNVKGYNLNVSGNIYLDKELNIAGEITLSYNNEEYKLTLEMVNKVIYLHFYNINVKASLEELTNIKLDEMTYELGLVEKNGNLGINIKLNDMLFAAELIDNNGSIALKLDDVEINVIKITNTSLEVNSRAKKNVEVALNEYLTYQDLNKVYEEINALVTKLNKGMSASFEANINDKAISGNVLIDENKAIKLNVIYNDIEINAYIKDKELYVEALGIKAKCSLADEELKNVINKFLNLVEIPNLDINEILNSLEIKVNEKLEIKVLDKVIYLDQNSLSLENVNVLFNEDNSKVEIPTGEYYEISGLYKYVDSIISLASAEAYNIDLNTNVNVKGYSLNVSGNIYLDKELNIAGEITLSYNNEEYKLTLEMVNKVIYLHFNELNFQLDLNDFDSLKNQIEKITAFFDIKMIDIDAFINSIYLVDNNGKLMIKNSLLDVLVDNITNGLSLTGNNFSLNATCTDKKEVVIPTVNYLNINDLLASSLIDNLLADGHTISFSLNVNALKQEINVSGLLELSIKNKELSGYINITILEHIYKININYVNNYLYLGIGNSAVKLTFAEILKLINIKIDLNTLFDYMNFENNSLAVGINGSQFNLPNLDVILSINDNININISNIITDNISITGLTISMDKSDVNINNSFNYANVFEYDDLNLLVRNINNYVSGFNDGIVINLMLEAYGLNINGKVIIDENKNVYATLCLISNDTTISINVWYQDNILYFNFNDLRFKVDASNFDVIIDTVKELFTSFTDNVDLNAKISDLLEGFKLVVEKFSNNQNEFVINTIISILSIEGISMNISLGSNEIGLNGIINDDLKLNSAIISFTKENVPSINGEYLDTMYVVELFKNLEVGVSSTGTLSLKAMKYEIILPYSMLFRLDLIELLKGQNLFDGLELELTITSMNYDPIILTISKGYLYLDSMETKFKYELPKYNINDLLNIEKTNENDKVDISSIISEICSYISNIIFVSSSSKLTITLNDELLAIVNSKLSELMSVDLKLENAMFVVSLGSSKADFDISASINVMNIGLTVSLSTQTKASTYNTVLTEASKNDFVLTTDFSEHPFVIRVKDIIKMAKGFSSLDYANNGQNFNINIPLDVDSGLVDTVNVSGNLGVYLDIKNILNGGDIFESFKMAAKVNIKAKMPWYLVGAKVNINIEIFAIGDGFLYVIVNGDAVGINFDITENLIDLKGELTEATGSTSEELTEIFLNDLLNQVINGFTTSSTDKTCNLTLSPTAVKVVNRLWRSLVDMVNKQIASVNNSTLTSLINGIKNFNMDITGFSLDYNANDDNTFKSLVITLSGYRHNTYDKTALVITLTHSGELASNYFDAYVEKSNSSNYKTAREEIISIKEEVKKLGEFRYTEEYYNQAKNVLNQMNNMSDLAKNSYKNQSVANNIAYYDELTSSKNYLYDVINVYRESDLSTILSSYQEQTINGYKAYDYFAKNQGVISEDDLATFLYVYNEVAKAELSDYAQKVNEFEKKNVDFTDEDELISYRNELNTLYNEFLDLRTTYQTAFMQFYSDEYNKLMDLVKNYNDVVVSHINSQIYDYVSEGYDLTNAMAKYNELNFNNRLKYALDSCDEIVWNVLDSYVYSNYIYSFDASVGAVTMNQAASDYVYEIVRLQNEYNKFSDEFKAMSKADMQALSDMFEPSKIKYKEEVVELLNKFNLTYTVADSGYFKDDNLHYYNYEAITFDVSMKEVAARIIELYNLGNMAGIDISSTIDDGNYYLIFKIVYAMYSFENSVVNKSLDDIASITNFMNNETYDVYTFKKRWGTMCIDTTTNHKFMELFSNAKSGSYAYTIYQEYQALLV